MTFAAAVPYALLVLFGAALVVAAFNNSRLIGWENRAIAALADTVRGYRETLEEEQRILRGAYAPVEAPPQAFPAYEPAYEQEIDVRAA